MSAGPQDAGRARRVLAAVLLGTGAESWSPVAAGVECHVFPAGARWRYQVRDGFGPCGGGERDSREAAVRAAHYIATGEPGDRPVRL